MELNFFLTIVAFFRIFIFSLFSYYFQFPLFSFYFSAFFCIKDKFLVSLVPLLIFFRFILVFLVLFFVLLIWEFNRLKRFFFCNETNLKMLTIRISILLLVGLYYQSATGQTIITAQTKFDQISRKQNFATRKVLIRKWNFNFGFIVFLFFIDCCVFVQPEVIFIPIYKKTHVFIFHCN